MEERLQIVLWTLGGAGFFGAVGAVFGAAAGGLTRRDGWVAGGFVGRSVAAAFHSAAGKALPPVAEGMLVGAADGASFLGVLGALAAAVAAKGGHLTPAVAGSVALGTVFLALGAAFFGLLAYGLVRAGVVSLPVRQTQDDPKQPRPPDDVSPDD